MPIEWRNTELEVKVRGANRKWELEQLAKLGEGASVNDVLGPEPAFAGDGDTEIEKAKVGCFVGIGIHTAKDSEIAGFAPPAPIEVKAPWVGVQFNPSAVGGGGI